MVPEREMIKTRPRQVVNSWVSSQAPAQSADYTEDKNLKGK